jgi:FkbM family methyltransferase
VGADSRHTQTLSWEAEMNVEIGKQIEFGTRPIKHSQNDEEIHILEFFKDFGPGRFLDIGASTGIRFSNTRALFEKGWAGVCVEPSPTACAELIDNYRCDVQNRVKIVNACISYHFEFMPFWDSGNDVGTLSNYHAAAWKDYAGDYKQIYVPTVTVQMLLDHFGYSFDFLNIDTEGNDWVILKQIDFKKFTAKMVCIEHCHSSGPIEKYLKDAGFKEVYRCAENLLMTR